MITLQAGLIENKVEKNDVGTIISQSPTDVMTAFNGISDYFKVSKNGAQFGNLSTGNYTVMDSQGVRQYISNTEINYLRIVHYMEFKIQLKQKTLPLNTAQASIGPTGSPGELPKLSLEEYGDLYTLEFDDELKTLLHGYPARLLVNIGFGGGTVPGTENPNSNEYYGSGHNYWKFIRATSTEATVLAGNYMVKFTTQNMGSGDKMYTAQENYCGGPFTIKCLIIA